jgi:beta-galactosidase GanA
MLNTQGGYPYGASYSPLVFSEESWQRDLTRMAENGMNLVRIADVHGSWDQIEIQRGVYRLEKMERFYQAAHQAGIQILLAVGTSCPPLWLATENPDLPILSSRGERYPLAASYHWACIHHPALIEAGKAYIHQLAEMAAPQPNHFGWQISNELGFPFMPVREKDQLSLYCYCKYCKQRFRSWVKEKYTDLETLTHAWAWGTSYFWYNDWAEVNPPEAAPSAWSGVTRWIDWRLFWQQAFADFAGWQHDLIHECDPQHPTSVNTFHFKGYDRFGVYTGLDQWKVSQRVDHIGYDLYPGSGEKIRKRTEHTSIFLDHGKSVAHRRGTDFWLHEVESGPIGGWVLGPDYNTNPTDIYRNGLEALGHDVKLMLYQPWQEWDYQPLHWGALVDLDGHPTDRLEAAGVLGRFLQKNAAFLRSARVPRGEVAILESKPNAIFFNGVGQEEILFNAQRGAYRAFWERDFQVDFVTPEMVREGGASTYPILVLPLMGLVSRELAQALAAYVQQGGFLIGFARLGTLDEQGYYHHQLPMEGLRQAFGIDKIEADDQANLSIRLEEQSYVGWMKRDKLTPAADTQILATFVDGLPAVTLAHYGEGQGLYFACQADSGFVNQDGGLLPAVLDQVLPAAGLQPQTRLSYAPRAAREIDAHRLETADELLLVISNYATQDHSVSVQINVGDRTVSHLCEIFPAEREKNWQQDGGQLAFLINLEKEEGKIIKISF